MQVVGGEESRGAGPVNNTDTSINANMTEAEAEQANGRQKKKTT